MPKLFEIHIHRHSIVKFNQSILFAAAVGLTGKTNCWYFRYWGSYSATYPAGGGGSSGPLALALAALQEEPRALQEEPRALQPTTQKYRESRCALCMGSFVILCIKPCLKIQRMPTYTCFHCLDNKYFMKISHDLLLFETSPACTPADGHFYLMGWP